MGTATSSLRPFSSASPLGVETNSQNTALFAESLIPDHEVDRNPFPIWMRWNRTSPQLLIESETKLLQRLKSSLKGFFVPIFGGNCFIRTVVAKLTNEKQNSVYSEKTPIVLVHGFASGLALWCKNVDAIAAHRPVYTFDLLGFGRSSRPEFPKEAEEVEVHWVNSLEEWREAIKLNKFILIGHSLGGYIATAYALRHPHRVAHLILVDPWGFNKDPFDQATLDRLSRPNALTRAIRSYLSLSSPLAILRAIGPFGLSAIHRVRGDLRSVFDQRYLVSGVSIEVPKYEDDLTRCPVATFTSDSEPESMGKRSSSPHTNTHSSMTTVDEGTLDGSIALDYVYHVNMQNPSGELAFKSLCTRLPWARHPMIERIDQLDGSLPMTFIFGSRSWMDISSGTKTKAQRPTSYVDVKIIEGAGHQVYAEAADEFNACINEVAARVDAGGMFDQSVLKSDIQVKPNLPSEDEDSLPVDRTRRKRRSVNTRGTVAHDASDEASN